MAKTMLLSIKIGKYRRVLEAPTRDPHSLFCCNLLETFSARTSSIRLLSSCTTYGRNRAFTRFLTLYSNNYGCLKILKVDSPCIYSGYAPATSGNLASQITLLTD